MSELNDIKIDNEEYWWDEPDNFVVDDERNSNIKFFSQNIAHFLMLRINNIG